MRTLLRTTDVRALRALDGFVVWVALWLVLRLLTGYEAGQRAAAEQVRGNAADTGDPPNRLVPRTRGQDIATAPARTAHG